jgi:DNA primase
LRPLSASEKASLLAAAARYHRDVDQVSEYLLGRGIGPEWSERFRLGFVADPLSGDEAYKGRLSIPGLGREGLPYSLRFRSVDGSDPKYLGKHGPTRLFNIRALHEADNDIHITEGELDAITLEMCGLRAVGVCGANSWKAYYPRMFAGFTRVYVWGDGDAAGRTFSQKVTDSVLSGHSVRMREGNDVNSVYLDAGKDGVLECLEGVK